MHIAKRQLDTYTGVESPVWVASTEGTNEPGPPITLDVALFDKATYYPLGTLKTGTPLARHTSTGLYGPYGGTTDEKQRITFGGTVSGGTYTLTYSGQTTGAIPWNATPAAVQAALEALAAIDPGDAIVTGGPGPAAYDIQFASRLANTDLAQMTATSSLTGSSPTVTVSTVTAGGADAVPALGVGAGLLWGGVKIPDGVTKAGGAMFRHGLVWENRLPFPVDPAFWADVPSIRRA